MVLLAIEMVVLLRFGGIDTGGIVTQGRPVHATALGALKGRSVPDEDAGVGHEFAQQVLHGLGRGKITVGIAFDPVRRPSQLVRDHAGSQRFERALHGIEHFPVVKDAWL